MIRIKKHKVSIVMPVFNEAEIIGQVVRDFYLKILKKINNSEFVICEDGSTDGTKEILKNLQKKIPLKLHTSRKRKGAIQGYKDSLNSAKNEIILFSDSDGTHDPNDFFKLIKKIDDYDMVIGWKSPRQDPFYRLFISRIFNLVINLLLGTKFHDINSGFRLIKKSLVEKLLPKTGLFPACILTELTLLAIKDGYKVTEVPVKHFKRKGESRALNTKKLPKLIWGVLRSIIKIRFQK